MLAVSLLAAAPFIAFGVAVITIGVAVIAGHRALAAAALMALGVAGIAFGATLIADHRALTGAAFIAAGAAFIAFGAVTGGPRVVAAHARQAVGWAAKVRHPHS